MARRSARRIVLWLLIGAAVLAAAYCVARFAFGYDVLDRTGWHNKDGVYRYLDYFGRPQSGWLELDGKTYYFAPDDGAMVMGWRDIDGERYYFRGDGVRAVGWLEKDGRRYYLKEDGTLAVGWLSLDGLTYYLAPEDGAAATGWQRLDGKTYYFTPEDGAMHTGWLQLEGKRYYLTDEGCTVNGWAKVDGLQYRFAQDGSAVTGWYEEDSGRYFFDEDGCPHSGWLEWEQKRYYLKEDGSVTTGWLTLEQDRYYFLPSGRMAIGEVVVDGISRFFTSTGKEVLLCNPWHAVPDDFVTDMVDISGKKIDRNAKEPLQQMIDAAKAEGVRIGINNSYRSRATQQRMWDKRVGERMEEGMTKAQAEAKTGESLAIPGHSEHETGLALDVNSGKNVYTWLAENCWDYGFILRYPKDAIKITGIIYEPWHFRYVGTELSLELEELGLCMEEYMTMLTEQQKNIPD